MGVSVNEEARLTREKHTDLKDVIELRPTDSEP